MPIILSIQEAKIRMTVGQDQPQQKVFELIPAMAGTINRNVAVQAGLSRK
jgi:hypothetical protein